MTAPLGIVSAGSMQAVHQCIVQHVEDNATALVAFDVDMTLTVPQHPTCYYPILQQYEEVLARLLGPLSSLDQDKVITLATQACGQQLAEAEAPALVKTLQQQGVKTMALTASLSGTLAPLGNLAAYRFKDLQELDFDFSTAFEQQEFLLHEIPAHNDNHPHYHQGILYANGGAGASNKGAVLVAFLQRIGWQPSRVVMVDDVLDNLTYIQEALATFDPSIQFMGIEYHGAKTYAPEEVTEQAFVTYWQEIIATIKGL